LPTAALHTIRACASSRGFSAQDRDGPTSGQLSREGTTAVGKRLSWLDFRVFPRTVRICVVAAQEGRPPPVP